MPITILDNARGFETGVESAHNIYNRINSYAQNQMNIAAQRRLTMMNNASAEKRSIYEKYGANEISSNPFIQQTLTDLDLRQTRNAENIGKQIKYSPTFDSPVAGLAAGQNMWGNIEKTNMPDDIDPAIKALIEAKLKTKSTEDINAEQTDPFANPFE